MHWSVSMVEFPVELSLIMLSKSKTNAENIHWHQNLVLKNHSKKVQKLICCITNRILNLTLKFGAKKERVVRDRIRYDQNGYLPKTGQTQII